jgi:hypothetical protein
MTQALRAAAPYLGISYPRKSRFFFSWRISMAASTRALIGQILDPTAASTRFQGPRPMVADAPAPILIGRILGGPNAPAGTQSQPIIPVSPV